MLELAHVTLDTIFKLTVKAASGTFASSIITAATKNAILILAIALVQQHTILSAGNNVHLIIASPVTVDALTTVYPIRAYAHVTLATIFSLTERPALITTVSSTIMVATTPALLTLVYVHAILGLTSKETARHAQLTIATLQTVVVSITVIQILDTVLAMQDMILAQMENIVYTINVI